MTRVRPSRRDYRYQPDTSLTHAQLVTAAAAAYADPERRVLPAGLAVAVMSAHPDSVPDLRRPAG